MPNWLDDEQQRAWRAYLRTKLLVDSAIARDLTRDSGLSMPDYHVLSALSETPDHQRRLTDLALRMQWSASRLSHHVTRMEQRGLVRRAGCSNDLRGAYIVLTDAGRDAIVAAAPDHVCSVRTHLIGLLSADELAALTSIGAKVAEHFGEECSAAADAEDAAALSAGQPQSANESPVSRSYAST